LGDKSESQRCQAFEVRLSGCEEELIRTLLEEYLAGLVESLCEAKPRLLDVAAPTSLGRSGFRRRDRDQASAIVLARRSHKERA